ncbi:MAG TPA: hypothetical protein VHM91_18590 [Verrucomicrobiales bacterium]|jgi:hypothetical protein|nr:hypothetical protein [Verrucomicrobiales bacterium]
MIAHVKRLLMILAFLAMGGAQILGINRGYLCECTGQPVITDRPSCDEQLAAGYGHGDEQDTPGSPHQHQKFVESLKSVSFTPLVLSLPPSVEMDWPATVMLGVRQASETAEHRAELKHRPPDDSGGNAPAGLLVARTVVMLV